MKLNTPFIKNGNLFNLEKNNVFNLGIFYLSQKFQSYDEVKIGLLKLFLKQPVYRFHCFLKPFLVEG